MLILICQVEWHGKKSFSEVLKPSIDLAERGFVLGPVTSFQWRSGCLIGEEAHKVFRSGTYYVDHSF